LHQNGECGPVAFSGGVICEVCHVEEMIEGRKRAQRRQKPNPWKEKS
jgi:hypothetical protein